MVPRRFPPPWSIEQHAGRADGESPGIPVSVTRPGKWGNPFTVAEYGLAGAIEKYRETLAGRDLSELRGKNLACYCPLDQPCHAEVLLELANIRVLFFNNLVNSYGKPFKCLQRAITVSSAKDPGEASEKGKREFVRLENVPNWKCHAQFLEVESRDIVRE